MGPSPTPHVPQTEGSQIGDHIDHTRHVGSSIGLITIVVMNLFFSSSNSSTQLIFDTKLLLYTPWLDALNFRSTREMAESVQF